MVLIIGEISIRIDKILVWWDNTLIQGYFLLEPISVSGNFDSAFPNYGAGKSWGSLFVAPDVEYRLRATSSISCCAHHVINIVLCSPRHQYRAVRATSSISCCALHVINIALCSPRHQYRAVRSTSSISCRTILMTWSAQHGIDDVERTARY